MFVSGGHVESISMPNQPVNQYNAVFRNLGVERKMGRTDRRSGIRRRSFRPAPRLRVRRSGWRRTHRRGSDRARPGRRDLDESQRKSGHWLDIALRGTKSNRDGIGARIKLVTKSGTQYNHMTTSVGYASSSDGPVHFGLGPDTRAESIEIHWPSGVVQTLRRYSSGPDSESYRTLALARSNTRFLIVSR